MKIHYAIISKVGHRSNNEDAFCEILDVFDFLCEKSGDDNYTGIMIYIEN